MADARRDALVRSVEALLAEKRAVSAKERELIGTLNRLLAPMGYAVVARGAAAPAAAGRRRRRAARSAGRRGPAPTAA